MKRVLSVALCLLMLAVAAFYSKPFIMANQCIVAANKTIVEEDVPEWIVSGSLEDLQLMDDETILGDNNITIKTKVKPKWFAWNNLTLRYEITAVAEDWETGALVQEASCTAKVEFVFKDFQWIVRSVEILD